MANDSTRESSIEQLLGRFAGDLWIQRRLELAEVLEHLEQVQGPHHDAALVEQWIRFIKFLDSECSGKQFTSDKQWSDLMNHMQISRRLNHRSVKFRDILRNYHEINSNQRQIKRLNEHSRLVQMVESLLANLDSLILKGCLNLRKSSENFIVEELSTARDYVRDRCHPVLNALRVELLNDTFRDDPKLEQWTQLANGHECSLRKVDSFLSHLSILQKKLQQLSHLIASHDNQPSAESSSTFVSSTIETCKAKFSASKEFNDKLVTSLCKRGVEKSLRFVKIISLDSSHAYTKAIIEACTTLKDCELRLAKLVKDLRIEFGRFYFVSDQELLKIIGLDTRLVVSQESSSRRIIGKLFSNSFERYLVDDVTEQLTGVQNFMGEVVYFLDGPILLRKKVRIYSLEIVRIFNETLRKLSTSLKTHLTKCFLTPPNESPPSDAELPVQVILLRDQINFSNLIEEAANGRGDIKSLQELYESKLRELSRRHLLESANQSALDRYKSSSVISFAIYFLSILRGLQSPAAKEKIEPNLPRHLRHYFDPASSHLEIKIGTSKFDYGFEYLPFSVNSSHEPRGQSFKRLINTRINELSFLVASAAVSSFKLGANPYGPAGSGKTETIKALGHLLGYQVVVHNCDETNDSESLDRIISGLAQTGLWGCFDEFNRLSDSTLSLFSARLELVQGAIREAKNTLETEEGQFMRINPSAAFFVTLNPGGDNTRYKGRRKLPANLRHLFIPIAMTQVEVDIIFAEMLMTSNALLRCAKLEIDEAQELGGRLTSWLNEMQGTDVGEQRCEWDLRLVMGILKRLERLLLAEKSLDSNVDWKFLLGQSIKCELEPRLTKVECDLLNLRLPSALSLPPTTTIIQSSTNSPEKYLEFQMDTHTGVVLVGPTTSGKSFSWRKLYSGREITTKWLALNPKSCQDLLGSVALGTDKWTDGLFTSLVRKAYGILLDDQSSITEVWIILDGPIDPDWIESLNSVLDDNQILTLGSGERLSFVVDGCKCIKLIFEVSDISLASPATISRLGLVLFENKVPENVCPIPKPSSSFEDFFQTQHDLSILVGSSSEARSCLIRSYSNRFKFIEYYCSKYSTSRELQELMIESGSTNDIIVLSNVHLIESDDKYGSRSFMELSRFMLTYRGYYDLDYCFQSLKTRFIVTLDNLNQLEDRYLSLAKVIHHLDNPKIDSLPSIDVYCLEEYIRYNILAEGSSCDPVVSFTNVPTQLDIHKPMSAILSGWTLYTFSTRAETHESIKYLEELVSRPLVLGKEQSILVLKSIECNLMGKSDKSKLFHLLNKFKMKSHSARFIYLDDINIRQLNEFWISLGPVYLFKSSSSREQLELYLKEKFKNIAANVSNSSKTWLTSKVICHVKSVGDEWDQKESYEIYIEQLSECIVRVINEAIENLEQKQRILSQGLDQLNNFGQSVEVMRAKFKLKEEELKNRKEEVEKLMGELKISIETAQNQRDKIELLKQQHLQRTDDIKAKSLNIEKDLKQVADKVEDSKMGIEQYLKPEALNEIKSLREAPKTIKDILEVLFLLLEVKDLSWTSIKSNLAKGSLRDDLTRYDARRRLNDKLLSKVELMMAERKSSFSMENAMRASKAVVPIIGWIKATLEYGKMLVKLQPLIDEMDKLSLESAAIIQEADELKSELARLDLKIINDNKELDNLNQKYIESQAIAEKIKCQLSKAEETGQSLSTQKSSWQKKLVKLNSTLKDDGLTKLCLACSLLVVVPQWKQADEDSTNELNHLLHHCELCEEERPMDRRVFAERAANLFLPAECLDELVLRDDGEVPATLHLMLIKLCLLINVVPFIEIDNLEEETVELRLVKSLHTKQMLCPASHTIACCKMDASTNISIQGTTSWSQMVDLNIRLGRLMCLKLLSNQSMDLEVAKIISTTTTKAASGSADNNRLAIILAGKLAEHPQIRKLVRVVASPVASRHSSPEIQSMLLDCLVSFYDPALSQSIRQHEQQLETKQTEVRDLEWRLLDRLAASAGKEATNSGATAADREPSVDLVDILIELQQLSRKLAIDVSQLSVGLHELKRKQAEYLEVALKGEKFYSEFLQPMGTIDAFYRLPLDRYCSLVMKSLVGASKKELNYSYLATRVARGLRSQDRLMFVGRLREKQLVDGSLDFQQLAGQFKDSFSETIHAIQTGTESHPQLMVVVHDSSESNPQLELDDIVRRYNRSSQLSLRYSRVSATSDEKGDERLKQIIEAPLRTNRNRGQSREEVECICIENSQLAAQWLNTWLVQLLRCSIDDCKVLILLIAEVNGCGNLATPGSPHELDGNLLAFAHVKHWYDESGLNLPARFKLITNRLISGSPQTSTIRASKLELSIRKLALLHVVCQERSRRLEESSLNGNHNGDEGLHCWLKPYVFDYNQLQLACKCLHWLLTTVGEPDWEVLFCHHLCDIIYGPRLETWDDKQALAQLVGKFIGGHDSPAPNQVVDQLEALAGNKQAQDLAGYEKCLSNLVSTSAPQKGANNWCNN